MVIPVYTWQEEFAKNILHMCLSMYPYPLRPSTATMEGNFVVLSLDFTSRERESRNLGRLSQPRSKPLVV
jgi:hypothetical protein